MKHRSNRYIQAVIFDMDGLLLDTERVLVMMVRRAAGEFGYTVTEDLVRRCTGVSSEITKMNFILDFGKDVPLDGIFRFSGKYVADYFNKHSVPIKPGVPEILEALDFQGIPKAVATSTGKVSGESLLERAGLLHRFDALVFGDQVQRGKPEPDIFLKAASKLGGSPENCLVFEDSENGIIAAARAGMRPVLVPDQVQPRKEILDLAFRSYSSLAGALTDLEVLLG